MSDRSLAFDNAQSTAEVISGLGKHRVNVGTVAASSQQGCVNFCYYRAVVVFTSPNGLFGFKKRKISLII